LKASEEEEKEKEEKKYRFQLDFSMDAIKKKYLFPFNQDKTKSISSSFQCIIL
jgi:hypothetical protein